MAGPIRIDIFSDTVCPWCYVGKRHLEEALEEARTRRVDVDFECRWQPFQLNPEMPLEGADRRAYWRRKFGDEARIEGMIQLLVEAGKALDIPFDFQAIARQPNTLKSHLLLQELDGDWVRQNQLKELILSAFFVEGRDIGDNDTLVQLATCCGVSEDAARQALADDSRLNQIRQLDVKARKLGITAVPTFVFDGKTAVVGAQPADILVQTIEQVRPSSSFD